MHDISANGWAYQSHMFICYILLVPCSPKWLGANCKHVLSRLIGAK